MKILQLSGSFWVSVGSSAMFTILQVVPYVAQDQMGDRKWLDYWLNIAAVTAINFLSFWVLCMLLVAIPWRYVEKSAEKKEMIGLSYYLFSASFISILYGYAFIAIGLWSNNALDAFDPSFLKPAMYMIFVGASGGLTYWLAIRCKLHGTANKSSHSAS